MANHSVVVKALRRALSALIAVFLLAGALPPGLVSSQQELPPDPLTALQAETDGYVRIAYRAGTPQARFIGTDLLHPIPAASSQTTPEQAARQFLATYGGLFGVSDQARELATMRFTTADGGRSFVRFQQVYDGIPVLGGELITQLDANRNVISAGGEILSQIAVSTQPTISAEVAQQTAAQLVAKYYGVAVETLQVTVPSLWVFNPALVGPGTGPTQLVWRLEVTPVNVLSVHELVLINAHRGSVALHFNQVPDALNRKTYTANSGSTLPGTLVCNESNPTCSGGDADAVAAHTYAGDTYDFYQTYHGRDGIDNAGTVITSTVHYCDPAMPCPLDNAFWSPIHNQMLYGDAHGYVLADDVVAHELTHGVTAQESHLFYYYQSGAINESFSDIWGEFVDQTNGAGNDSPGVKWLIGEDVAGLGAVRNMQNPPALGQPDKMTSPLYHITGDDYGGVHTNSGIGNKAAYLLTDGGTFNGQTVTGLGLAKVAKIYYETQTNLLTSGADYPDLYEALYQACLNLVGTSGIAPGDCQHVRNATNAVEMNQHIAGFNTLAPLCPTGQFLNQELFFDGIENGTGNWAFGATVGNNRWVDDNYFYVRSGAHALLGNDNPAAATDTYAAMAVGVALPQNAYLRFAHAYGFEDTIDLFTFLPVFYDGGVLEYSVNGGVAWQDAGSLFDVNGYNGTLSVAMFEPPSNPLYSRDAFVADSHGYISSRLNLSPLAGQNVRFRWRMGLDNLTVDQGWWVDDVRFYTCGTTPLAPTPYLPNSVNPQISLRPLFDWGNVSGATSYNIQISTNQNFASLVLNLNVVPSAYVPTADLPKGATLFWRVRTNGTNGPSAWSRVRHFDSPNPPSVPTLFTPAHNVKVANGQPTLDWSDSSPGVDHYEVQISTNSTFTAVLGRGRGGRTAASQYTPEAALGTGMYYWRVRAVNVQGQFSQWSAARSFDVP